jgi:hypothetical protein
MHQGHGEWQLKWGESGEHLEKLKKYVESDLDVRYKLQVEAINHDSKKSAKQKKAEIEEIEKYVPGIDDGTFFISFSDWRNIFDNLFMCIKFKEEWSGRRISDAWKPKIHSGVVKKGEASYTEFAQKNI